MPVKKIKQLEQKNKMKLETKIRNLINETNATKESRFNVIAHELWGNSQEGYSTNASWYIATNAELSQVLEAARGRWEVFKVNYLPKARVCDIADTSYDENLSLEIDFIPFLEIRKA
jgi:hypothetical protein